MDVHPTKNVSIGIDPYPYVKRWFFNFVQFHILHSLPTLENLPLDERPQGFCEILVAKGLPMDYLEVQFHVTLSDDFTIGIGLMYIYISQEIWRFS